MDPTGAPPPAEQRPGLAGAFLVASFYVFLLGWLVAFVAAPAAVMRWEPIVITSGSMAPVIRSGDVVLVERRPTEDLGPGTVITFNDPAREDALLTHRIAAVNPDGTYRTQGDANGWPDSTPVAPEDVVGVGRLLIPLVGLPMTWLLRGALGLLLVWVLATVAALSVALDAPVVREGQDARDGVAVRGRFRRARGVVAVPVIGTLLWLRATGLRAASAILQVMDTTRRTRPTAVRAWSPTALGLATSAAVWGTSRGAAVVSLATTAVMLVVDPSGPELRIGRWLQQARSGSRAAGVTGRRVRVWVGEGATASIASPILAILLLTLGGFGAGRTSAAAFTSATSNVSNSFTTGTWCTPGSVTALLADADSYTVENNPTTNYGLLDPLQIVGDNTKNQRGYFHFAIPASAKGCTVTAATLLLDNTNAVAGQTYEFQALSATFIESGAGGITWANQPAVAGPTSSWLTDGVVGVRTITITAAAQGMFDNGLFSLRVRDTNETGSKVENKFKARENATGPRITVSWS